MKKCANSLILELHPPAFPFLPEGKMFFMLVHPGIRQGPLTSRASSSRDVNMSSFELRPNIFRKLSGSTALVRDCLKRPFPEDSWNYKGPSSALFYGHSFIEEKKRGYFMEPFQPSPKPLSHRGPKL